MTNIKGIPWNMDSAPKDRNILLLCEIHHYRHGEWSTVGHRWKECWWDNEPSSKCWQEWCGNKNVKSTEHIKPVAWTELPVIEQVKI